MLCFETSAENSLLFGRNIFKVRRDLLIQDYFKNFWYVWQYTNWPVVSFIISWVFLWTGTEFAKLKGFGKLLGIYYTIEIIKKKRLKISMFSFKTLVGIAVSSTDLLEPTLFNSFCKLDKLLQKKEKFRPL